MVRLLALWPHVGDGHQCQALLQCEELAVSVAPCCGSIFAGPQLVHRVPVQPCPWSYSLADGGSPGWDRKCWMLLAIKWRGQQLQCANRLVIRVHWECQGSMQCCWASTGRVWGTNAPVCGSWARKGFCFKALEMGYKQLLVSLRQSWSSPNGGAWCLTVAQ